MTTVRNDIPAQYKWDLSALYADEAAFAADFEKAEAQITAFSAHEATMLEGPAQLLAMFEDLYAVRRVALKLYQYAARHFDVDTSDNRYQALSGKVIELFNKLSAAAYFIEPYILRLSGETVAQWYDQCPALAAYRRDLDAVFRYKPYTLSEDGERLMSGLQRGFDSHEDIYSIFKDSDLRYGRIRDENGELAELTDANYVTFLMSRDRRVRRAAFAKMYATFEQFRNTFATVMNGFVKEKTTLARVRGYADSLTASTFHDEVTPAIYNNLCATVSANLDALFEYYDVKREVLGVPQLHMYDLYVPLIGECTKSYTYEQAVELVLDTVRVFGDEYHDTLEAGIRQKGWIDVYPNTGKRAGAYSAGCYDSEPYILLNYTEQLDDVSTLAHEAGHSMHSYFSRANNSYQESEYTIFVAEVASTVNELLLAHKLLRESSDDMEKLSVLNQMMETYKGTLFRQTMFAEFEKTMYELCESGEPLTADLLCEIYYATVRKYFGPRVVCDKQIACEWMRIPHFYYNFYVYKYATCISAAGSIVRRIEEQGDAYIGKYLAFLKCGGSKSPLDSLKVADIDMADPAVIEDAVAVFRDTVAQFKALYKKVYGE